jgi:ATP-binding cassette, subfamily C, bacterial
VRLAAVVLSPLFLALVCYGLSLGRLRERLTNSNEAEERFGDDLASIVTAVPILQGLSGQQWARARLLDRVAEVAAASLAASRMQAVRHAVVGCGALVPLVCVLVYSQATHDLSAGALLGAVTYLLTVLAPALSALVGGTGSWAVQLQVLMRRLERVARAESVEPPHPPYKALPSSVAVVAKDLSYAYPGAARTVLANVSFSLAAGELLAVLGPNGCGKSTLARMIIGLLAPTSGMVRVARGAAVEYVPQHAYLFSGTLRENLSFDRPIPDSRLSEQARLVGLGALVDDIGLDGELIPSNLGRVDHQRVALARALAADPDLIVLDETLAGLDGQQSQELEAVLQASGAATVLISHDPSLAVRAHHVVAFEYPEARTRANAQREFISTARTAEFRG